MDEALAWDRCRLSCSVSLTCWNFSSPAAMAPPSCPPDSSASMDELQAGDRSQLRDALRMQQTLHSISNTYFVGQALYCTLRPPSSEDLHPHLVGIPTTRLVVDSSGWPPVACRAFCLAAAVFLMWRADIRSTLQMLYKPSLCQGRGVRPFMADLAGEAGPAKVRCHPSCQHRGTDPHEAKH